MKKILSVIIILCLLFTTGCAVQKPAPTPADTELENTEPENSVQDVDWNGGLVMLRQGMIETPQIMAVAFLGYYDGSDLSDWLATNCTTFCDNHPIFNQLDTSMIIGEGKELYCIVAMDENADISVNRTNESGEISEILLKCDGVKPLLVTCTDGDTEITLVDSNGNIASFYPSVYDGQLVKNNAVMDFTSYEDIVKG